MKSETGDIFLNIIGMGEEEGLLRQGQEAVRSQEARAGDFGYRIVDCGIWSIFTLLYKYLKHGL